MRSSISLGQLPKIESEKIDKVICLSKQEFNRRYEESLSDETYTVGWFVPEFPTHTPMLALFKTNGKYGEGKSVTVEEVSVRSESDIPKGCLYRDRSIYAWDMRIGRLPVYKEVYGTSEVKL